MISAKLLGLSAAVQRIGNVKSVARSRVSARLSKMAEQMADDMRAAVPVATGALRDSIRTERAEKPYPAVLIIAGGTPETMKQMGRGVVFDQAVGVEYGTTKMEAQPFFMPVVEDYRRNKQDELVSDLDAELGGDA